jgi:hypothetical protein
MSGASGGGRRGGGRPIRADRGTKMRGPGPPATGHSLVRAVDDALRSLSAHPEVRAREDYEPFTAAADHEAGRVIVVTAAPGRFSALLDAMTVEGGFAPGAVFERLVDATMLQRRKGRTPAQVRREVAERTNPFLHLGNRTDEIRNAFDKIVVVTEGPVG